MKASYKIALAVSVIVCILAIVLIQGGNDPQPTEPTNDTAQADAAPEPRKTLRSDSTGDGSVKSLVNNSQADKPANPKPNSIADAARSRILAAQNLADAEKPDTPASNNTDTPDKPTTLSIGNNTSGPIALARTETEPVKSAPQTKPGTPKVDSHALDAILGPTSPANSTSQPGDDRPANTLAATDQRAANRPITTTSNQETYTVQPGDNLSLIADKLYNDESRWVDISQANPEVDPTKLKIGQVLQLPDDTFTLSQEEPAPKGPGQVQTYNIQPGDNLSTVAEDFYKDPTLWRVIYNFNREKIGDNPNAIQVGMEIEVPPQLSGAQ